MGFTSLAFLICFSAALLVYFLLPGRLRMWWLLAGSLCFALSYGLNCVLALFASTLVTYSCALFLERQSMDGKKKLLLGAAVAFHVLFLSFFKYNSKGILLPVGLSFYTFQAMGYLVDVYRGTVHAEHKLLHFALFQAFFPKLAQGPIERSGNLLAQLRELEGRTRQELLDAERLCEGLQLLLWGLFQKLMIADRIAVPVNAVYGQFKAFGGVEILLATVLYAFQIYCDFAGYTDMARGVAKICGLNLLENFRRPYLSDSFQDFWHRWHISLSSWLRDYIYIPLGGNRKGKLRKSLNVVIVFAVSGIWHGTGFHFLLWGLLWGILQLLDMRKWKLPKPVKQLLVFGVTIGTWMVFRVNSLGDLRGMLGILFTDFRLRDFAGMQLGKLEWGLLLPGILLIVIKDILNEKGICLKACLNRQVWPVRCLIYTAVVAGIVILGVYGAAYDTSQFLYTQF